MALPLIFGVPVASAAFITTGCANVNVSCTLAELTNPFASINIDSIVFNNFASGGPANAPPSPITVTPIDGVGNGPNSVAGLRFTPTNPAANPWRAELNPLSPGNLNSANFVSEIYYSVNVLSGRPLDRATLSSTFNLGGSGLAFPSIYTTLAGPVLLEASCSNVADTFGDCLNATDTRTGVFSERDSFQVESVLVGSVSRVFGTTAFVEITGMEQTFVRVPEPASLAMFAAGLFGLAGVRRFGRARLSKGAA